MYDRKKIFEQAKEQIVSKRLIFVEEVVAFLPCGKSYFYDTFKIDSHEMDELKGLIETNKISLKTSMRKKWYDSDNATLQISLMKLIASPEELKKLSMNYTENINQNQNENKNINFDNLTPEQIKALLNEDK